MAALWELSHVLMGDKASNAVQRCMKTCRLPTHTVLMQEPFLSRVIIWWLGCLLSISSVTSTQATSIPMPSVECNHLMVEFPQAFLEKLKPRFVELFENIC